METTAKKQISERQLSVIREKRNQLKEISAPFKALVKDGEINTINQGLITLYASQGHSDLKTLRQWNEAGKRVKKGEHALLLWGKPKERKRMEQPEDGKEVDSLDFFPICFVFSVNQVEDGRA